MLGQSLDSEELSHIDREKKMNGTPRELKKIAREVLEWVAMWRQPHDKFWDKVGPTKEELRKIELCAQATLNMAMMYEAYGQNPEHTVQILLYEQAGEEYKQDASKEERIDPPCSA